MNAKQRIALAWPPLCLRLALGITFIWAGCGKVLDHVEVRGDSAARLANMGVNLNQGAAAPSGPPTPVAPAEPGAGSPKPAGPDKPLPSPDKKEAPKQDPPAGKRGQSTRPSAPPPRTATASAADQLPEQGLPVAAKTQQAPSALVAGGKHTASDFPEPVRVRRLYTLALLVQSAAEPAPGKDGKRPMSLWPVAVAGGSTPVYLAWSVAMTETVGGTLLLLGMLTRLSALAQAGVMLGAMWLTQIGPAVQSGNALLGFLPRNDLFAVNPWMPLMWQFALFMMALALFFAGPGVAALDNALFQSESPAPPKPAAPPKNTN